MLFPNIHRIIRIMLTFPVMTCNCVNTGILGTIGTFLHQIPWKYLNYEREGPKLEHNSGIPDIFNTFPQMYVRTVSEIQSLCVILKKNGKKHKTKNLTF